MRVRSYQEGRSRSTIANPWINHPRFEGQTLDASLNREVFTARYQYRSVGEQSTRPKVDLQAGSWTALTAAVLFGLSTPLAKGLLGAISPQVLAGLFYLGSGVGLAILRQILQKGAGEEAPLIRTDLPWFSGAVVSGGIVAPVLLLIGLQHTPASDTSLLLNLEVVFTVILAWVGFHENIDRRVSLGIVTVLLGGVVVSWQPISIGGGLWGPFAIAVACLCWGIDNNFTQKVSASDPRQVTAIKGLIAGTVNLSFGILFGAPLPSASWIAAALTVGFFTYGLSLMFYVLALRKLGTARTGAYFSTGPFIGAVVALVLWRELITLTVAMASVAMLVGAWFIMTERHIHLHVHESVVHTHRHIHDLHHHHEHGLSDPLGEPHSHSHEHRQLAHSHDHDPDIYHRHRHDQEMKHDVSASMLRSN